MSTIWQLPSLKLRYSANFIDGATKAIEIIKSVEDSGELDFEDFASFMQLVARNGGRFDFEIIIKPVIEHGTRENTSVELVVSRNYVVIHSLRCATTLAAVLEIAKSAVEDSSYFY